MKSFRVFLIAIFCTLSLISCAKKSTQGRLGIVVPIGNGKVTKETPYVVTGVYEGSPAYNAGIRPDDVIIQIDSKPLVGMLYDDIYKNYLLGKSGTKVTIVILRDGNQMVFDIIRGNQ